MSNLHKRNVRVIKQHACDLVCHTILHTAVHLLKSWLRLSAT